MSDIEHKINVKFPNQEEKTRVITQLVQTIYGSPNLTPKEKQALIKKLPGITRDEMTTLLNQLYGGGTKLSLYVASLLSGKRRARVEKADLVVRNKKKKSSRDWKAYIRSYFN